MNNAFSRSRTMMAAIAAAMALASTFEQQAAMDRIGPYVSRGKGKGIGQKSPRGAHMAAHRQAMKKRRVAQHRARR